MNRRVLVHASVVTCLVVCTAVPGRSQRRAMPAGGPLERFEAVKLFASDAQSGSQFGASVDVDGKVAVVGAIQKAYVFRNHDGHWIEEQILRPPGVSTRPLAVAVDGEVIAVGSTRPIPGAVTIYRYDGVQWSEEASLSFCCSYQSFGWSVDLDDGVLAVGDPDTWLMGSGVIGTVSLFRHRSDYWESEGWVLGTIDDAKFGHTVSVSGDRLLVGVPFVQSYYLRPSNASLFWFDGTRWTLLQRIEEPNGIRGTHMGIAVALTRDAALISDPVADPGSIDDAGLTYLLRNVPGAPRMLEHAQTSTSGREKARHGQEVAMSDDIALIGERGLVTIRRIEQSGWRVLDRVRTGPQVPSKGRYLATNGNSHWIGQPYDAERGERAGAVLVLQAARLALSTTSTTIAAGGTLSLRVHGAEPFAHLVLALTEWDDTPTLLPVPADFVELDGALGSELRIPHELAGHSLGLTLHGGSKSAGWIASDVLRLEITR